VSRLSHPHIVQAVNAPPKVERPYHFLVMELFVERPDMECLVVPLGPFCRVGGRLRVRAQGSPGCPRPAPLARAWFHLPNFQSVANSS